jgi:hypothetical protein
MVYFLFLDFFSYKNVQASLLHKIYSRNKSWKPECALSFNMGWRILAFYPEPEARDKIYTIILCCPCYMPKYVSRLEGIMHDRHYAF